LNNYRSTFTGRLTGAKGVRRALGSFGLFQPQPVSGTVQTEGCAMPGQGIRADIQGLRATAVALVVLNHVGVPGPMATVVLVATCLYAATALPMSRV
jgi:hypothetical protein